MLRAGYLVLFFFIASILVGAPAQGEEGDFRVREIDPQFGWATETGWEPGHWRPVPQPNLADELNRAPAFELEKIGPAPNRVNCGPRPYLAPNPDGKTWDMVFPYRSRYRGFGETVIHDFGTGETKIQSWGSADGDSVLTPEKTDFHMKPGFFTKGKMVFCTWVREHLQIMYSVYDPAVNRFVHVSVPFGDKALTGVFSMGEDGKIYGIAWPREKSGFVPCRFDPETYEAKLYPTFGPANRNLSLNYMGSCMEGDWFYAKIGNRPWHLLAFNFKTQESHILASSDEIIGDHRTIAFRKMKGGIQGDIKSPAWIDGISDFNKERFDFWLDKGRIFKRDGDIPPWSDQPARENRPHRLPGGREFQHWGDFVPEVQPPEIKDDSGNPMDIDGTVCLQFRSRGTETWETLKYKVKLYPGIVRRLIEVNDHQLFAVDEGYGQHVFYDLRTNKVKRFLANDVSPYSLGIFKNRLYVSGYPNFRMEEYDLMHSSGVFGPRLIGFLGTLCETHCPLAGTYGGADGCIYTAGITYERRRVGGGLGWYNPGTGEMGGRILEDHRPFWMTNACSGRYMILSTKCEAGGKLFCWDILKKDFVYQLPVPGVVTPGPVAEVYPGYVLGHAPLENGEGILYGFRAETGEILWTKRVPVKPVTAVSQVRRHAYAYRRGPDGFVWTFFGETLVRINPANAEVVPLGTTKPAQIAFAMDGVFIAGGKELLRIKGLSTQ